MIVRREIRDLARAALEIQRVTGCGAAQARQEAAAFLGLAEVSDAEFSAAAKQVVGGARRPVGRPRVAGLTKRDAVATVAVYFQSIGAGVDQSVAEARRWLGVPISRKVALEAIKSHRATAAPDDYRLLAELAYAELVGSTNPLPATMTKARKRRTVSRN